MVFSPSARSSHWCPEKRLPHIQIMLLAFILALVLCANAFATFSLGDCDSVYAEHCPEASGSAVVECIGALDQALVSDGCKAYVNMHLMCKEDINRMCPGQEFTGDLLVCLTEWNRPRDPRCIAAVPRKQEERKREQSSEERRKAEARRRIRNKATKMAKDQGRRSRDKESDL